MNTHPEVFFEFKKNTAHKLKKVENFEIEEESIIDVCKYLKYKEKSGNGSICILLNGLKQLRELQYYRSSFTFFTEYFNTVFLPENIFNTIIYIYKPDTSAFISG